MENKNLSENSSDSLPPGRKHRSWFARSFFPFQRALVRGLAVVLPPLLTIVLFIWAWNTIESYILAPVEKLAQKAIVWSIDKSLSDADARTALASGAASMSRNDDLGRNVLRTSGGQDFVSIRNTWLPLEIYTSVENSPRQTASQTVDQYYEAYVRERFLKRQLVLPAFLALFVVFLYLVGKLLAMGAGRLLWSTVERLINRIPLIRNVYSSVKQVTDFAFNDNEMKVTRVVALQYPCEGIWSMGFVTGEGMAAICEAAGEPMINVLMPTSPMPATGFTVCVAKSKTIDLNITMDQAIQYCVSCGVVTPIQERPIPKTIEAVISDNSKSRK